MANIWQTRFFSILFNAAGGRSRPGFLVRSPAEPDHRRFGDGVQFGGGHRQLAALAERSRRVRSTLWTSPSPIYTPRTALARKVLESFSRARANRVSTAFSLMPSSPAVSAWLMPSTARNNRTSFSRKGKSAMARDTAASSARASATRSGNAASSATAVSKPAGTPSSNIRRTARRRDQSRHLLTAMRVNQAPKGRDGS